MRTGRIFNVQRFSLQDGPGLRSTVFLKGCPLTCAWCHNPESRAAELQVIRLSHRCMACGRCDETDGTLRTLADVEACPTGALQAVGREWTAPELVEALLRDRIFYDESGGGVTFSGGEPLAQPDVLLETLELLQGEGVHTALDTCGQAPWPDLESAAARSDLVLYDLKLMDDGRHQAATGVTNRTILENLKALSRSHRDIRVRVPIIPGVNDDDGNLDATAEFLASLGGIRQVDLLPYHPTGETKFERVGIPFTLGGTAAPDPANLDRMASRFRARGLTTTIGGRP